MASEKDRPLGIRIMWSCSLLILTWEKEKIGNYCEVFIFCNINMTTNKCKRSGGEKKQTKQILKMCNIKLFLNGFLPSNLKYLLKNSDISFLLTELT